MATASRVASGVSYPVSPAMREKVEKTIRELGYTPNALARALARNDNRSIGVIVGAITDPYFAEVTRGVEDYAKKAGYLTILCNADRDITVERAYVEMLRRQHAAGVVFAGGSLASEREKARLDNSVRLAAQEGARIISLASRGLKDVPVVTVDNRAMLYDLTTYIASLGRRRIAFVAAPAGFTTGEQRRSGFEAAMRDFGLEPANVYSGGFDADWGRRAAMRMLQDGLPEAIIAFNDESAIGALLALRDAGVRVPDDVAVAGVDDIRDATLVGLTSVAVPMYELGAFAARGITHPDDDRASITILPHRLVRRLSTEKRG